MSDPYGSWDADKPYGEPPFAGQQRPEVPQQQPHQAQQPQQPAYPQYPGYGQQPPHPQQPYGYAGYPGYPGYPPMRDPERRPGVVSTACVIAIVMSSLGILASISVIALGAFADSEQFATAGFDGMGPVFVVMGFILLAMSIAAIVCAAFALRRRQGARITLVVLGFVTAAYCLVNALSNAPAAAVVSVLWCGAAVAVSVMLLSRSARDWYATRPSKHSMVVPYQQSPAGPQHPGGPYPPQGPGPTVY